MPKRYKPDEKKPEDSRYIVVKLLPDNALYLGFYHKDEAWPWVIELWDGDDVFRDTNIDWWLDPMEVD